MSNCFRKAAEVAELLITSTSPVMNTAEYANPLATQVKNILASVRRAASVSATSSRRTGSALTNRFRTRPQSMHSSNNCKPEFVYKPALSWTDLAPGTDALARCSSPARGGTTTLFENQRLPLGQSHPNARLRHRATFPGVGARYTAAAPPPRPCTTAPFRLTNHPHSDILILSGHLNRPYPTPTLCGFTLASV